MKYNEYHDDKNEPMNETRDDKNEQMNETRVKGRENNPPTWEGGE